jgi:hypothetical protein
VYSIQHYVTKFVSDIMWQSLSVTSLATDRWFSPDTLVFSTNKTYRHDIIEILLKVALTTLNQPHMHTTSMATIDWKMEKIFSKNIYENIVLGHLLWNTMTKIVDHVINAICLVTVFLRKKEMKVSNLYWINQFFKIPGL